jgi:hypothetical protein
MNNFCLANLLNLGSVTKMVLFSARTSELMGNMFATIANKNNDGTGQLIPIHYFSRMKKNLIR